MPSEIKRICYPPRMSVRSCRVTIRDTKGIEHSTEVTAESLYEAVALGLRAILQCSWVEDIGQSFTIRVLARDTPVEHTVEFRAFHKWLEQRGRSPSEIRARGQIGSSDEEECHIESYLVKPSLPRRTSLPLQAVTGATRLNYGVHSAGLKVEPPQSSPASPLLRTS